MTQTIHIYSADDNWKHVLAPVTLTLLIWCASRESNANVDSQAESAGSEGYKNLAELYHKGNLLVQEVKSSTLGSSDPKYQLMVKTAIAQLMKAGREIQNSGLFSDNESGKEVASHNLKYLLCDFMVGDMYMSLHDQKIRQAVINTALVVLNKFLKAVKVMGLMTKEDEACYKRKGKAESILKSRDERMARLRRNRELETELKALVVQEKKQLLQKGSLNEDDKEEDERERKKAEIMIQLAVTEALSHLRFAADELQMLEMMQKRKAANGGKLPEKKAPPPRQTGGAPNIIRINSAQEFIKSAGILRQPREHNPETQQLNLAPASHSALIGRSGAVSGDKRAEVLNEMFVPKNMPTMTVDTMLELERRTGKIPDNTGRAVEHRPYRRITGKEAMRNPGDPESDPDSDDLDDKKHNAAQKKKREWDKYTEEHEKGAGNTLDHRGSNFM